MRSRLSLLSCTVALSLLAGTIAHADTLLIDRVRAEHGYNLPTRGMSMTQVQARYGAPLNKLSPAGGDSRWHPTINRWSYTDYTVYFERDRVIDAVLNRASPDELGPKNAPRTQ